jgi:hypothetical protein
VTEEITVPTEVDKPMTKPRRRKIRQRERWKTM